jgi:hypothetical protein
MPKAQDGTDPVPRPIITTMSEIARMATTKIKISDRSVLGAVRFMQMLWE